MRLKYLPLPPSAWFLSNWIKLFHSRKERDLKRTKGPSARCLYLVCLSALDVVGYATALGNVLAPIKQTRTVGFYRLQKTCISMQPCLLSFSGTMYFTAYLCNNNIWDMFSVNSKLCHRMVPESGTWLMATDDLRPKPIRQCLIATGQNSKNTITHGSNPLTYRLKNINHLCLQICHEYI